MKSFKCNKCGQNKYTIAFIWHKNQIVSDCNNCRKKENERIENEILSKLSLLSNVNVRYIIYDCDNNDYVHSFADVGKHNSHYEIIFVDMPFEEFCKKTELKENAKELYENSKILENERRKSYLLHNYPDFIEDYYYD